MAKEKGRNFEGLLYGRYLEEVLDYSRMKKSYL